MPEFEQLFTDEAGRLPTAREVQEIRAAVLREAALPVSVNARIDDVIIAAQKAAASEGEWLAAQDARTTIARYAASKRRSEQRRATLARGTRRVGATLLATAVAATAVGAGAGAYVAVQDPVLDTMEEKIERRADDLEQAYRDREAALHERFFGPLPALAQAPASTYSPLETRLLVKEATGIDVDALLRGGTSAGTAPHSKRLYDSTSPAGTRIVFDIHNANDLDAALTLMKALDGKVTEVHRYAAHRSLNGFDSMAEILDEAVPDISVLFAGGQYRVVDHTKGTYTLFKTPLTPTQQGIEGTSIYTAHARKIYGQVLTLIARGPNAPTPSAAVPEAPAKASESTQ